MWTRRDSCVLSTCILSQVKLGKSLQTCAMLRLSIPVGRSQILQTFLQGEAVAGNKSPILKSVTHPDTRSCSSRGNLEPQSKPPTRPCMQEIARPRFNLVRFGRVGIRAVASLEIKSRSFSRFNDAF